MKIVYNCFLLCLAGMTLAACSNDERYLTRVDVQLVEEDNSLKEEEMILDIITLDSINSLLDKVKWEPSEKKEIAESEDLIATLFYTEEKAGSDQLYLYRIWFNSDGSLSIVSNKKEEGYGILAEKYADKLKDLLESDL